MKKGLLTSLIIFSSICYSQQTRFKISRDTITDFIVTDCQSKTQNEIYQKTIEWVSINFKNSDEVIQSKIENKMTLQNREY